MAKLKVLTKPLDRDEMGEWGTFISHSSGSNEIIKEMCKVFDKYGINYLWDNQIAVGAENFAEEITGMINKCLCAVVVVNEKSMNSQWVNYEIGLLDGLGKKIFLYDEDGILENMTYRFHYDKYCPAFSDFEALAKVIRDNNMFYTLFNNETAYLTNEMFRQKLDEYVIPVSLRLTVPGLSMIDPKKYSVKALIVNFGNFTKVRHNEESVCCQTMDDIENDICEESGCPCCLNSNPDRKLNPECVLLNHVWEKINIDKDTMEIVLPLHKTMGTTFKLFVDADSDETANEIRDVLDRFGAETSLSMSGNQNRVYLSLRSSALNGVFRLKDDFSNNFICPGIVRL